MIPKALAILCLAVLLAGCGTCDVHGSNAGGAGRCKVLSVPL